MSDKTYVNELLNIGKEFKEENEKLMFDQININVSTTTKIKNLLTKLQQYNGGNLENNSLSIENSTDSSEETKVEPENSNNETNNKKIEITEFVLSDAYYRLEQMEKDGLL